VGRLANYKYFNMDESILNALELFDRDTGAGAAPRGDDSPRQAAERKSGGDTPPPRKASAALGSAGAGARGKRLTGPRARIAFITAVYGSYEKSLKRHAAQTVACDFIGFTDQANIVANNWQVDTFPYHARVPSRFDTGHQRNSRLNNNHTFNTAKYYKTYFHHIPRLSEYEVVVWLDGTISVTNPKAAELLYDAVMRTSTPTVYGHVRNGGGLRAEAAASRDVGRYTTTHWSGQSQPFQPVFAQVERYTGRGYSETYWANTRRSDGTDHNLWVTCMVGWNMKSRETQRFLDMWNRECLEWTTQDQLSFPYVAQTLNMTPHTLPDAKFSGNYHHNNLYTKHDHGQ